MKIGFGLPKLYFKDGKYLVNLDDKDLTIGGISGSYWATPVLQVEYKGGEIKTYHCHYDGEHRNIEMPAMIALGGVITREVQSSRNKIELEEI